ncbi:hypothetical protein JTF08_04730 [Micrococcaceae bacterium RIT802]|nr:hypothetical protein [Micrococcaceae bacterium RIT 802]
MELTLPLLAGSLSTAIFAISTLPMLVKAGRSKNMASYSLGNIALANVGNLVHSVYVFSLPAGPVWVLHSFYLVSTVLMLVWYLRYEGSAARENAHVGAHSVTAPASDGTPSPQPLSRSVPSLPRRRS